MSIHRTNIYVQRLYFIMTATHSHLPFCQQFDKDDTEDINYLQIQSNWLEEVLGCVKGDSLVQVVGDKSWPTDRIPRCQCVSTCCVPQFDRATCIVQSNHNICIVIRKGPLHYIVHIVLWKTILVQNVDILI